MPELPLLPPSSEKSASPWLPAFPWGTFHAGTPLGGCQGAAAGGGRWVTRRAGQGITSQAGAAGGRRRVGSDVCGIPGGCSDGCSQWRSLAFWEFPISDAGALFPFDLLAPSRFQMIRRLKVRYQLRTKARFGSVRTPARGKVFQTLINLLEGLWGGL